jgi:hypothetical protein
MCFTAIVGTPQSTGMPTARAGRPATVCTRDSSNDNDTNNNKSNRGCFNIRGISKSRDTCNSKYVSSCMQGGKQASNINRRRGPS